MATNEESGKPWDDARKSALVAQIVSGKLSVRAACQRHELSAEMIQGWVRVFRRTALKALDEHLRQTFLSQGADAALIGSAEYTGTLADIPLADLLQTFQMGGKDGVISITHDGQRSHIWCAKGEIVDAESGRLHGEAAVYRILDLERGQVFADFRVEARARTIDMPVNVLLLEAARRKDECARMLEHLGDVRAIYRPAAGATAARTDPTELEVLALCDGERGISDVLFDSELGDWETLSAMLELVEREFLQRDGTSVIPPLSSRAIITNKDTPQTAVSFLPLTTSQHPESPERRSPPLSFALAGVALGAMIWLGVSALSRATSDTGSAPPAPPALAAQPAAPVPSSFVIDSRVEPENAQLWLDGTPAGAGHLYRELQRDGTPHSLEVRADAHATTTLLFVDAPPPAHIVLEKLPPPPPRPAPSAPVLAPAPTPPPAVQHAVVQQPAPAPKPRRPPPPSPPRTAPEPSREPAAAPRTSLPRVQIIENDTPVIQVIE